MAQAKAKEEEKKVTKKPAKKAAAKKAVKEEAAEVVEEKQPEEILKEKKAEAKAAKKAGPKAKRAKADVEEEEKPEKPEKKKVEQKRRSRLERRGKKYREAIKNVDPAKFYELKEAIVLLPKTSYVKFDPSVEVHANLGIDPKQADQAVRSTVVLPHGSGKSQRVFVLADGDDVKKAEVAGADRVGLEDILEDIKAEKIEFDILVATPKVMPSLGKYAKVLGPKGLMPNPKSGTVAADVATAVKELKGGRIEFRTDKQGIIHQVVGKLSFQPEQLEQNITALFGALKNAKPSTSKGQFIVSSNVCVSMGPPVKLDVSKLLGEV